MDWIPVAAAVIVILGKVPYILLLVGEFDSVLLSEIRDSSDMTNLPLSFFYQIVSLSTGYPYCLFSLGFYGVLVSIWICDVYTIYGLF